MKMTDRQLYKKRKKLVKNSKRKLYRQIGILALLEALMKRRGK